jgi:glucose/arabinose dehydrogenase
MTLVTRIVVALFLVAVALPALLTSAQQQAGDQIAVELAVEGLDQPLFVTHAGDSRLFVLEKPGVIRIVQNGQILPQPFLDISGIVASRAYEQGILGLAFHPEYETNGTFYVSYSAAPNGRQLVLASYQRAANDPNRADPDSATILMDIYHEGNNHYGGMLAFGPHDGYLYFSTGDGGGAYDPLKNGQDLSTLLGAILRVDVDAGIPYSIPEDNPFVGVDGARDEIWAYGLRNPWRFSFDSVTGDMYIGDVGQEQWEEINVIPADSAGGKNFGWPETEGFECSKFTPDCDPALYIPPVTVYPHTENNQFVGCSVTAGYTYRGDPASPLYGTYFYSDFCNGTIWTLKRLSDGQWQEGDSLSTTINASSFGEDVNGELYLTDLNAGRIYRLTTTDKNPLPFATAVSPVTIPAGSEACVVTISGFNLRPESTVRWNGEARPTTRSGPTSLSFRVESRDIAQPGSASLTIVTPAPGGGESEPVMLQITGGQIAGQAIANTWARTDHPVRAGMLSRTWMWGPEGIFCATQEPYLDAPGGMRTVQYFDKSRMEVNDPDADPSSIWYVTNGLLVTEMITGEIQTGNASFTVSSPSVINVAGDLDDQSGPTYLTFNSLLDRDPLPIGSTIIQKTDRSGDVWNDEAMGQYAVRAAEIAPETGHVVAEPFWNFMTSEASVWEDGALVNGQLFENPYYATGLPISEAYWATVRVAGTEQAVLIQAFERRVLTYTPSNPPGWQVELGNVGLHYYFWRYGYYPYPEQYEP